MSTSDAAVTRLHQQATGNLRANVSSVLQTVGLDAPVERNMCVDRNEKLWHIKLQRFESRCNSWGNYKT